MRSVALAGCFAALGMLGCPTAKQPDKQPSGLVKTSKPVVAPIDADKATKDLAELMRAVRMPHHRVGAAHGAHKFSGTSTAEILSGDQSLDKTDESVEIAVDDKGNYRAIRNLSDDNGREVIFVGDTLYLRPRHNKFHRRAPESKTEPRTLRDQFFSTLASYMEPLAHVLKIGAVETTQFAGRDAFKIGLTTAASPRARTKEAFSQRTWRETIRGGSVSGHIVLDKKSGAPLAANVKGEVEFERNGKPMRMKISVSHALRELGKTVAIAAPPPDQTVDTLQLNKETAERDRLLKGIAPPAGKTAIPSN